MMISPLTAEVVFEQLEDRRAAAARARLARRSARRFARPRFGRLLAGAVARRAAAGEAGVHSSP